MKNEEMTDDEVESRSLLSAIDAVPENKKENLGKSTELAFIQSESVFPKYEFENEDSSELFLRNCDGIIMPKSSNFCAENGETQKGPLFVIPTNSHTVTTFSSYRFRPKYSKMHEEFMTQENLQELVNSNGQQNGGISSKKLSSVAPETKINGNEKPRLNENGGARMRVSCEAGNDHDYEPPPDLNPAELGEENEKRELPSDLWGTLTIAFSFINLAISFCLVNLNNAQNQSESNSPTPIHSAAEKYYKILLDVVSCVFAFYMYLARHQLCDRSRRRRVDNFKLKALNVLSFGAVTNNLTCLIILMINQDETEVIDIVIHFSDLLFYLVMVAFMNLMNRESFHENIKVRLMIGWIMVTLVTQWFVIFFEAKEVCADFLVQGDLSEAQFKTRQRWVKTLEDVMYVMKTEGTIFIFEWMFVLNGSFKIQTPSPEFTQFEKSHEKLGISVPLFRRFTWHLLFSGLQSTRIALMIIQVIKKERLWAYLTMGMCLLNTYLGLVCIGVIVYYAFTQPEKAVRKRRCHNDEDDGLMNFSSIAVYLNISYHLIVGAYYSMFATEDERQQCANLMTGAPQNEGFGREGEIAEYSYAKENEFMERVRRSSGGEEEGQVALLEASSADVLAFGIFYDFYYLGELLLVTLQTIMIMYLRRSRLVLGIPKLKFWLFGLMYYNCSDWISIAWIAEENPGIRPMDVCGEFLSKGVIHLLLTVVLFYRFTAWRLLNRSICRAVDEEDED